MKSALPKVLHKIAGRSMLGHVLALAARIDVRDELAVVVGPGMDDVRARGRKLAPARRGLRAGEPARHRRRRVWPRARRSCGHRGDVLVLYADTPLLEAETLARLVARARRRRRRRRARLRSERPGGATVACSTDAGRQRSSPSARPRTRATAERAIRLCNSGVMAFRRRDLLESCAAIGNDNAKGEYYLTDAVEIVRARGGRAAVDHLPRGRGAGRQRARRARRGRGDLAAARARARHGRGRDADRARDGLARRSTPRSAATSSSSPTSSSVPASRSTTASRSRPSAISRAPSIGAGARVGPFARLRPGADLGTGRARRQLRRGQERRPSARAPRPIISPTSATARSAPAPTSAPARSSATTTASSSTRPRSAPAPSSARTRRSSRRSRSATAPTSARAASSPRTSQPDALALERSTQEERPQWAAKFRAADGASARRRRVEMQR